MHRASVILSAVSILILLATVVWSPAIVVRLKQAERTSPVTAASVSTAPTPGELAPGGLAPLAQGAAALLKSPLFYLIVAGVFVAESLIPAQQDQPRLSRGFLQDFGAWFLLDAPLKGLVSVIVLGTIYFVFENHLAFFRLSDTLAEQIPIGVRILLAVVVGDLMRWLHHVLTHRIGVLWLFHSVHHSQREMNLFTDLRFHAFESITLAPVFYAPLYVMNLDFEAAIWTVLLLQWYPRLYHANLRTNFGPLRYLLVTPQSHRIHHSVEPRHANKNFGSIFSIWDRLFGTQWTHVNEYPPTGISDASFPWEESVRGTGILANYVAQLTYPFRRIMRARQTKE